MNNACPFSTSPPSQMDCADKVCAVIMAATVRMRPKPASPGNRLKFLFRMSIEYPLNWNTKISRITGPSPKRHRNVTNNGHLESFRGFEAHRRHPKRPIRFTQVGPGSPVGTRDSDIFGHHEHPLLIRLLSVAHGSRRCPSPSGVRPSRFHPNRRRNLVEGVVPRG